MHSENRVLQLEGGRNFRDLGGYPAADGRRVKWGKVYRSGSLHALTDDDYRRVDALGIKLVCDMRATSERASEPFRNAGDRPVTHRIWEYETDSRALATRLMELGGNVQGIREAIFDIYRNLPFEFAPRYREIFAHLVAGETPLIFNCSAGKDRTGVAAALLLVALGVPRAVVLEDYSLTEKLLDFRAMLAHGSDDATGYHFVRDLPDPARSLLLRSDPDYLDAAFGAIEARTGSIAAFLDHHLGLDDRATAALRDHLLD